MGLSRSIGNFKDISKETLSAVKSWISKKAKDKPSTIGKKRKLDDTNGTEPSISPPTPQESNKRTKRSPSISDHEEGEIDSFVWDDSKDVYSLYSSIEGMVYKYNRATTDALGGTGLREFKPNNAKSRKCFNCGSEDHALADCPEPRNHRKIRKARFQFQQDKDLKDADSRQERIHESGTSKQEREKFLHLFKPGKVSPELREALGLEDNDEKDPDFPWFQNMARWGYPPGWTGLRSNDPFELMKNFDNDDSWNEASAVTFLEDQKDYELSNVPKLKENQKQIKEDKEEGEADMDLAGTPSPVSEQTNVIKRFVEYPTTRFQSSTLPVFKLMEPYPLAA